QLMALVGSASVPCLGMWSRPEGTLAVEDPLHDRLRLLTDHGIYYEFVPVESLGAPEPVRLGVGEGEMGVPYAVALTSPAGLWGCLIGVHVRCERRQPLLLRLEEMPVPEPRPAVETVPARIDAPAPVFRPPPPHPRSGGIPAAHPGTPFHNPWSVRADR